MTTPEDTQAQPTTSEPSLQQKFFRYFQHEVTALQEQMDRLGDRPVIAGERADAADASHPNEDVPGRRRVAAALYIQAHQGGQWG